jgi:hypothetical protein
MRSALSVFPCQLKKVGHVGVMPYLGGRPRPPSVGLECGNAEEAIHRDRKGEATARRCATLCYGGCS